jgi:hypothetical protein
LLLTDRNGHADSKYPTPPAIVQYNPGWTAGKFRLQHAREPPRRTREGLAELSDFELRV